ncbi:MAG: TSUP family transporter [Acutalibacteraceae bacterium]|nr:TSUP family transporter [Acutalibacteraceae bacterium]
MSEMIAGFLSGIIGAMGLGGGAVLLIYLTLFGGVDQLKAQGINLLFFIPIAVVSVIIYAFKKQIKWKTVLLFSAAGLAGAAAGVFISEAVGSSILGKIFGGILIAAGIWQAISAFKKQ